MNLRSSALGLFTTTVLLSLATGCALRHQESPDAEPQASSDELALQGDDANETESDVGSLGRALVGGAGSSGAVAPASLSPSDTNGNGSFFQPAGCVTAVKDLATQDVVYTFNGCTGPYGLVHLTGVITVHYDIVSPTEVDLTYHADDFKVNLATISAWDATAHVVASGDDRTMTWHGALAGTTARGRAFARTSDAVFTWNTTQPCLGIDGVSRGNVTGKNLQVTVDNYRRCRASCPDAGGSITIENVDTKRQISIDYLGGPSANVTGPNGNTITIKLYCGL